MKLFTYHASDVWNQNRLLKQKRDRINMKLFTYHASDVWNQNRLLKQKRDRITSPSENDGRLCFRLRRYGGRYI